MAAADYAFGGSWWTGASSISIRWGGTQAITPATIDAFHDGLFAAPPQRHRECRLPRDRHRRPGRRDQGDNGLTVTEDFARSGSQAFLLGVAFDTGTGDHASTRGRGWAASRSISAPPGAALAPAPGCRRLAQSAPRGRDLQRHLLRRRARRAGGPDGGAGQANLKLDLDIDVATGPAVLRGTEGAETLSGGAAGEAIEGLGGMMRCAASAATTRWKAAPAATGSMAMPATTGWSAAPAPTSSPAEWAGRFVFLGLGDRRDGADPLRLLGGGGRPAGCRRAAAGPHASQALLDGGYVRFLAGEWVVRVQVDADGGGDAGDADDALQRADQHSPGFRRRAEIA